MLNKNQSKKSNYWKYCAILPVLVGFVLLFQIKTIAQEKRDAKEITQKEDSTKIYKIQKATSDQELKEIVDKIKKDHNVDVVVSEVKRNSKNELTNIKVAVKKDNDEAQTIQIDGDKAIKNCIIIVNTENDGTKKTYLVANGSVNDVLAFQNEAETIKAPVAPNIATSATPPVPPVPPTFPGGPMPAAPPVDMTKMPKPPVAPTNHKDKVAMANFEKEMEEFEKKMEAWEPDMTAYEKQVEEIMAQRELTYDKEMAKYEIAMEKFNADMENFNFKMDFNYEQNMKDYELNMKQFEKNMKIYEQNMKAHEKAMKKMEKENKRS